MKICEILTSAEEALKEASIDEYKNDAWLLFEHVFQMNRTMYFMKMQDAFEKYPEMEAKFSLFQEMIQKRGTHYPLQYIIGHQEFMGLDFKVNHNVLIPRQDTEVLVELVLKQCRQISAEKVQVLDMCTGSGCIAISIAKLAKVPVEVTAVDLSGDALTVARENAGNNNCDITFIQSDLFEKLENETFDIIVSNPPYIPSKAVETLMDEVRMHEPRMALDGTEDGLEFYRNISREAAKRLKPNGAILYEIGCEQGKDVSAILKENGFEDVKVIKDYANLDRVVCGIKQ